MDFITEYFEIKRVTYTFSENDIIDALAKQSGMSLRPEYDHKIQFFKGDLNAGAGATVKITVDIPRLVDNPEHEKDV